MASANGRTFNVCIDGRILGASATGVGRYADTLLETLRLADEEPMVLVADGRRRAPIWRWTSAPRIGPRRAMRKGPTGPLTGSGDLFREAQIHFDLYRRPLSVITDVPAGVMHWTYPVPLRMVGWRNIYTVHDAIPLNQPSLTPIDAKRHRRLLEAIVPGAERLLAISEAARGDIVTALGCDPSFVVTVPQGVTALPTHGRLPMGLMAGEFYLCCGSIEPRKNVVRLVEAHAASVTTRPLVIVGPDGWCAKEVLKQISGFPNVIRLPYQTKEGLGALVRDARALLFPSLAEGFGLPVMEAMIMGTPVMTSDIPALAETAAGAALLVDPYDPGVMAAAIARLDRDDSLVAALAGAGKRRAKAFSIADYSRRLTAVHTALMESRL